MVRTGLIWSGVLVAMMAAIAVWANQAIPEGASVPLHWGPTGEADRFGSKSEAVGSLWALVGLGAFLTLVFALAPSLDPLGANLRRRPAPYLIGWLAGLGVLTLVSGLIAASGAGVLQDGGGHTVPRIITGAVALLLVALGNLLGKVRPNFILGVRTPWTLTSDIAWERTHRFAGRLFVLSGLAGLAAAAFAPPPIMAGVLISAVFVCAIGSVIASYVYWRAAPDKRRPAEPA